jgi:hypothetical protein
MPPRTTILAACTSTRAGKLSDHCRADGQPWFVGRLLPRRVTGGMLLLPVDNYGADARDGESRLC